MGKSSRSMRSPWIHGQSRSPAAMHQLTLLLELTFLARRSHSPPPMLIGNPGIFGSAPNQRDGVVHHRATLWHTAMQALRGCELNCQQYRYDPISQFRRFLSRPLLIGVTSVQLVFENEVKEISVFGEIAGGTMSPQPIINGDQNGEHRESVTRFFPFFNARILPGMCASSKPNVTPAASVAGRDLSRCSFVNWPRRGPCGRSPTA